MDFHPILILELMSITETGNRQRQKWASILASDEHFNFREAYWAGLHSLFVWCTTTRGFCDNFLLPLSMYDDKLKLKVVTEVLQTGITIDIVADDACRHWPDPKLQPAMFGAARQLLPRREFQFLLVFLRPKRDVFVIWPPQTHFYTLETSQVPHKHSQISRSLFPKLQHSRSSLLLKLPTLKIQEGSKVKDSFQGSSSNLSSRVCACGTNSSQISQGIL